MVAARHVLPLIQERGAIWPDEAIRIITWQAKPLLFVLQTLVPECRKRQPAFYELTACCSGRKVMLLAWSNGNAPQLISFIPGEWERNALEMN